jgi:hypothetical protein
LNMLAIDHCASRAPPAKRQCPLGARSQGMVVCAQVRAGASVVFDASAGGPTKACRQVSAILSDDAVRLEWMESARTSAILGACPRSRGSVVSGLRCWIGFAHEVLHLRGREFPPTLAGLQAWSVLFRCSRTFANYVGYLKLGCHLLGLSCAVLNDPVLRKAQLAIDKRRQFISRPPMFIRRVLLERRSTSLRRSTGGLPSPRSCGAHQ